MKGKIKAYSADVNAGVVAGEDGKSYSFPKAKWSGKSDPEKNQFVDYDASTGKTTCNKGKKST